MNRWPLFLSELISTKIELGIKQGDYSHNSLFLKTLQIGNLNLIYIQIC